MIEVKGARKNTHEHNSGLCAELVPLVSQPLAIAVAIAFSIASATASLLLSSRGLGQYLVTALAARTTGVYKTLLTCAVVPYKLRARCRRNCALAPEEMRSGATRLHSSAKLLRNG